MRRHVMAVGWIVVIVSTVLLLPSTSSAQTINACVSKNGTIRIVAAGAPCPDKETPLQWNAGLRVYDANGAEIGPLVGTSGVTFSIDGKGYVATVGPDGWTQSQSSFYFLDSACSGDRYVTRSGGFSPVPAPLPLPTPFFASLQVLGTTGYYQNGVFVKAVLPPAPADPALWRWDPQTSSCVAIGPYASEYTYWLGAHSTVELPVHPAPFTIR